MSQASKLSDRIGQFTGVPNSVIRLWPKIGVDGMALFLYLRYCTNAQTELTFPAYATIRSATCLTFKRIARGIRALEAVGVMTRKRRYGQSTLYTLLQPASPPNAAGLEHRQSSQRGSISPANAAASVLPQMQTTKTESTKTESTKIKTMGASAPAASTTKAIQARYIELLGYEPTDWANGESTAARLIAIKWTPDQLAQAYTFYKADPFWETKRLRLATLLTNLPEFFRNGGKDHATTAVTRSPRTGGLAGGPEIPSKLAPPGFFDRPDVILPPSPSRPGGNGRRS